MSHSIGDWSWRNVCQTGSGDPRQAKVITSISASEDQIRFDETGQYQFVIQGQNCTASVRRTRVYRLVKREMPAAPVPSAAPSAVVEAPRPIPTSNCDTPGPASELEVRPPRKLMQSGEEFQFRAVVTDDQGCTLKVAPTWSAGGRAFPGKILAPGRIKIDADAPETEFDLTVSSGNLRVRVAVEVVSRERFEALLQTGTFNARGESTGAARSISTGSVGARVITSNDRAERRRKLFITVVGALTLLVGLLGLLLTLRHRRSRARKQPAEATAIHVAAPPTRTAAALICPTCRQEYPADAQFCAADGNRLRPIEADHESGSGGVCPVCGQGFDPGVKTCSKHDEPLVPVAAYLALQAAAVSETQKVCPICGTQYPGDSQFCGTDGAALVPMN